MRASSTGTSSPTTSPSAPVCPDPEWAPPSWERCSSPGRRRHWPSHSGCWPPSFFGNARQPFDAAIDRAWGAALTLILLVFVLTAIARVIARRFTVR
ncbi:MAG: hypothetical protein ACRD07_12775 [Acidimicrobiales bacterium]